MARILKLSVGRVRVTSATGPSEAGYVQSLRKQMRVIEDNILKVVEHIGLVTPEALEFGLEPIFEESQRLVPVDTGDLKRSGFIETRRTSTGASAVLGYGRYGRPSYAGFVHENLLVRHAAGTQAKFLEAAVTSKIQDFRRRVELWYKRAGLTENR